MSLTLWSTDDYVAMPWRNGLGTTTELAREDCESGFLWRLSRADVTADGPFSNFPGIDRFLFLLSGAGLKLAFADRETILNTPYASAKFPGDEPVVCTLLNGPCQDFNIMVNRARASAKIAIAESPFSATTAPRTLLHVLQGAWVLHFEGRQTPLPEDSLILLNEEAEKNFSASGEGVLLRIDILLLPA
jgi:environmental stress-induced protein Ves